MAAVDELLEHRLHVLKARISNSIQVKLMTHIINTCCCLAWGLTLFMFDQNMGNIINTQSDIL